MQLPLEFPGIDRFEERALKNAHKNKVHPNDGAFHNWYRFVLSFPPHLVRNYISRLHLDKKQVILDPFCGTGTTLVESKLGGISSIGIEANPFAHFASWVKTSWDLNTKKLESAAQMIGNETREALNAEGLNDGGFFRGDTDGLTLSTIDQQAEKLLINNSISSVPLHKTLTLLRILKQHKAQPYYHHALLALAKALVFKISNLRFGPEVGITKPKTDYPVVQTWLNEIKQIVKDIDSVQGKEFAPCHTKLGDSREIGEIVDKESIDAVITSPPYPNEKDYTRTTRLESVILGFINNAEELRSFKKSLLRSNTRGIYKDDCDDKWVANNDNVIRLAEAIERKRVELGKTSGFEKLYSRVTLQYFGGMARHFADLQRVLRKGALLAYVVGDQASYFKVMIRTGTLLAEIAQSLGYELVDIELFRRRFATATSSELNEEVVLLRWPG